MAQHMKPHRSHRSSYELRLASFQLPDPDMQWGLSSVAVWRGYRGKKQMSLVSFSLGKDGKKMLFIGVVVHPQGLIVLFFHGERMGKEYIIYPTGEVKVYLDPPEEYKGKTRYMPLAMILLGTLEGRGRRSPSPQQKKRLTISYHWPGIGRSKPIASWTKTSAKIGLDLTSKKRFFSEEMMCAFFSRKLKLLFNWILLDWAWKWLPNTWGFPSIRVSIKMLGFFGGIFPNKKFLLGKIPLKLGGWLGVARDDETETSTRWLPKLPVVIQPGPPCEGWPSTSRPTEVIGNAPVGSRWQDDPWLFLKLVQCGAP